MTRWAWYDRPPTEGPEFSGIGDERYEWFRECSNPPTDGRPRRRRKGPAQSSDYGEPFFDGVIRAIEDAVSAL